tara:strand:+ start:211 stop:672 length:462 start_codon:yes stop_codon:yes gene_type:complete
MKSIWVSTSHTTDKPWGTEINWATGGNSRIQGKVLTLSKGMRNSLKYNGIKDETLFLMSGKLQLTFSDEKFENHKLWQTRIVNAGETINIQSGCPYRIRALELSTIIEIGSRSNTSPPHRFHDDYGRHCSDNEFDVYKQAEAAEKSIFDVEDI